ncbi:Acetyltransferase (GNAT) family protein [Nocardioides exalbidus]|uniref:Acetyltransferase (GNAT) family protein n=1 Tax=Nocardioides exalbidus TaxID=402596 RepID=A0A1H4JZT7_9ACTN|nr:GNAT family N-acetyltransferase [Nocardioides exalbidus]SEB51132.1 Acetyltransferase (GNAT) family protein [Nocardioides exalbidus]
MPETSEPHHDETSGGTSGGTGLGSHTLGPHVVGRRIVVRHLLPDGRASDVLGVCTAWGADALTIDRDGPPDRAGPVTIALADVVTGKPVPPRASVRAKVRAREAEGHGLGLWPDMERVDLGEWVLRCRPATDGDRPRKRANSALAMGDADLPLSHATNEVRRFYEARGQVPMVQVEQQSSLERWFRSLGWQVVDGGDSHFQLAPVPRALRAAGRGFDDARITETGQACVVEIGDGTARGEAFVDGDWIGLHTVEVDPTRRREGLGTAVIADLLDWGGSLGATTAWLHVEVGNVPALATYERLGFVTHHSNRYLAAR